MNLSDVACAVRGAVTPSFLDLSSGRRIPFHRRHNTLSYMSAEAMAAAFGGDPSYIPARIGFIYGSSSSPSSPVTGRNQKWNLLLEDLGTYSKDVQVVGFSYAPTLGGEKPASLPDESSSSSSSSGLITYPIYLSRPGEIEDLFLESGAAGGYTSGPAEVNLEEKTISWSIIEQSGLYVVWNYSRGTLYDPVSEQTTTNVFEIPLGEHQIGSVIYHTTDEFGTIDPDSSSEGDYTNILSTGSNAITFHAVSNSQDLGVLGTAFEGDGSYIYEAVLLGYHNGKHYILARASLKDGDTYRKKPAGFEVALDWTVVFH